MSWCLCSLFVFIKKDYADWDCAGNKAKSIGEPGMPTAFKYVETTNKKEVNDLFSMCMMEIKDLNLAVTWLQSELGKKIRDSNRKQE